ncbi:MAG: cysteine--tRNA ligase [Chloroflexi bacterium]|nr:cysteine--tRNA ligase [Chloroflexota bacterium]MDA1269923.1 cysteine--tRNA ligase [Chloroflexota bacterium]PKB59517.1 MAG: cysteine--tRNA ligase [SAR202 cluster bacterium Casp-Chloro-G2]
MLRIYNTLAKRVEEIHPTTAGLIQMYTCGPTVYRDAHIGNMRTYLMADWVRRSLIHSGLEVTHIKNITDVGHMRQELVEAGGDKMLMAALAEGKTVQEIADMYAGRFFRDEARLNIMEATVFPWASHHIPEMVSIVESLVAKGHAYEKGGNLYFDVPSFPGYGKLSNNTGSDLLEGVRSEADPLKSDPRDFTLWKAAEPGRDLKWDSPWGPGFPGWHIECSAMASKYLGESFDIHTGGVDNIFPHHEDEIAQSEAAFGNQHVNYWIHAQHLLADGAKMAKSGGNVFLIEELIERGFSPLSFRYLCMTVRYRHRMNFTFTSLKAAEKALTGLRHRVWLWSQEPEAGGYEAQIEEYRRRFWEHVESDLDLPSALAMTWEMVRSELPGRAKMALLLEFDQMFGLDLDKAPDENLVAPDVTATLTARGEHREKADYSAADTIRGQLATGGYVVQDTPNGTLARPKTPLELRQDKWVSVSSSREVESYLNEPADLDFTFILNAYGYPGDVKRCIESMLTHAGDHSVEAIVIDNGSTDGTGELLEEMQGEHSNLRVVHCDHVIGDAASKNIGLMQSRGRNIVVMDGSAEITGDILSSIAQKLDDPTVGIFGPWGLSTGDMQHFHEEVEDGDADAMQAYCMAFRRESVNTVGLMRECFRFYRNLDIDYCFQFKDKGYRVVADSSLPLVRHEHRQWTELDDNQRDELSRKNFGRFLKRWGNRPDLLIAADAVGFENQQRFHH